jgi:hypothetical protein
VGTVTPKPSEAILSAASPTDALRLVAEYIDILYEQHASPKDEWGSWGEAAGTDDADGPVQWSPDPADEAALAQYQEELQGCEDDLEGKVLRAKIELTRDKLHPPVVLVDNSGAATETDYDEEGNAVVNLPPATPEQIDFRGELVGRLGLRDQYGDELGEQAEESFIKGGPLLLYLSDREFVNSMADDVKRQLVVDVEQSSPREAQEMARDILKANTDDANDLDAVRDRILGDVESGAIHNAP